MTQEADRFSAGLRSSALRLLHRDGIERYSVGSLVLMIGVITPFT